MSAGKGDKFRPTNKKQFDKNWDNINWSSKPKNEFGVKEKRRTLKDLTEDEYYVLLKSGMFWEFYPDATGNYKEDCS